MSESVESSESWIAQRRAAAEAYAERVLAAASLSGLGTEALLGKEALLQRLLVNAFVSGHEECARVCCELMPDVGSEPAEVATGEEEVKHLHLTVDGDGLVSLWDHEMAEPSYLRLRLTASQAAAIEDTRRKGGRTP